MRYVLFNLDENSKNSCNFFEENDHIITCDKTNEFTMTLGNGNERGTCLVIIQV